MTSFAIKYRIIVITMLFAFVISPYAADLPEQARLLKDAALEKARSGQAQEALSVLDKLAERFHDNLELTYDRIVISSQAGQNREALILLKKIDCDKAPDYVIRSAVGTCRKLKETELALKMVNSRLVKNPDSVEWRIKRAQLLVDKGQAVQAAAELEKFREQRKKHPDWLDVRIYAAQIAEDWMAVLRYSEEKLKGLADPDLLVLGLKVDALIHLGAAHAAELIIKQHPELKTPVRNLDLADRLAGVKLRWSGFASLTMSERMQRAETVIKDLDRYEVGSKLPRNLASLRVLALHNANRWQEAVDAYQTLKEKGDMARNVTAATAGSYLSLQQPEIARELYQQAVDEGSIEETTLDGLFYSLIEEENFKEAYELIEGMKSQEPPWRYYAGSPSPAENNRRLDIEMMGVNARFYGDQLNKAWLGIDRLREAAPGNGWILESHARIALARKWRHQALEEYKAAAAVSPDSSAALVGVAGSLLALGDFGKSETRLLELESTYPESPDVKQLRKDWEVYEMSELWSDFVFMSSQGPELDGDGVLATAEYYGSPFACRWRPVLQARYAWAEIIEGQSSLEHIGVAAEYRSPNWEILAGGGYVESRLREDAMGNIRVSWNPGDHWSLAGEYSSFNLDMPLRALWYGITADRSGASLTYRWHESRLLSVNLVRSDFTDGNERWEAGAIFRQRIIDVAHFDLDALLSAYGSQNTRKDAPYYNPEEDLSLSVGLDAEHVIWRRYDRTWVQRLIGEVGNYDQKHFTNNWTGRLGYEHRLTLYPDWEFVIGIEAGRRVYDGEPEPFYGFNFLIHARF